MYEESNQARKNQINAEQQSCDCGCEGQENLDFEKAEKKNNPE
ncbi:MAG: hypothetical protein ACW986_15175 [Promethearchaeota archaeon]|jgi:hypothetical protein